MDSKLYLTISAIVLLLYGIGFLAIPAPLATLYGVPPEPHVLMVDRFFGSVLLALGVITWLARDFTDWAAIRGVVIGNVVGYALSTLVLIWSTVAGLLNGLGWGSTIVNVALALWALYVLSAGARKLA
ncbi:MAG TPA: hypothetical protein VK442_09840 [Xanthobacteraceae bacterium]|nr:hypothetical protein [Xanthobacteraceae bacterium]